MIIWVNFNFLFSAGKYCKSVNYQSDGNFCFRLTHLTFRMTNSILSDILYMKIIYLDEGNKIPLKRQNENLQFRLKLS